MRPPLSKLILFRTDETNRGDLQSRPVAKIRGEAIGKEHSTNNVPYTSLLHSAKGDSHADEMESPTNDIPYTSLLYSTKVDSHADEMDSGDLPSCNRKSH